MVPLTTVLQNRQSGISAWPCICMFIMTYFIAVYFKDMFTSAPRRWQDNSTETCTSFVKHCMHKLQNRAFVGVTWVIYF
jgi:hypothetical protein